MGAHVGSGVVDEAVFEPEKGAVLLECQRGAVHLLPRMVGGAQVFLAVLGPSDRPASADGRQWDEVILRVELPSRAKTATHMELHQPHPALVTPTQHVQQDLLVDVGDLGRAPNRDGLRRLVVLRQQPARLERHCRVALDAKLILDHQVRLAESLFDVAQVQLQPTRHIGSGFRLQKGRAGGHGFVRIEHHLERLVVDVQPLGRILGSIARVGNHHRNRLSRVARDPVRERPLEVAVGALILEHPGRNRPATVGQVRGGDDVDHARRRLDLSTVYARETCVGKRAAHHKGMDHPRPLEVGNERSLSPEQWPVLFTQRRRADAVKVHVTDGSGGPPHRPSPPR